MSLASHWQCVTDVSGLSTHRLRPKEGRWAPRLHSSSWGMAHFTVPWEWVRGRGLGGLAVDTTAHDLSGDVHIVLQAGVAGARSSVCSRPRRRRKEAHVICGVYRGGDGDGMYMGDDE